MFIKSVLLMYSFAQTQSFLADAAVLYNSVVFLQHCAKIIKEPQV